MSRCFLQKKEDYSITYFLQSIMSLFQNNAILNVVIVKLWFEHTIAFSHIFEFYYVSICFIPMFHLFAISPSQCAPADSVVQSINTFLVAWPVYIRWLHDLPHLTDIFVLVSIDYCIFTSLFMFELVYVLICFIRVFSFICNLSIPVGSYMAQQGDPPTHF